jgi:hypothetical protein
MTKNNLEGNRKEGIERDRNVVQPNIKSASLKGQSLLYNDIPDDDYIDYHDVKIDKGSPEGWKRPQKDWLRSQSKLVCVSRRCTEFAKAGDRV